MPGFVPAAHGCLTLHVKARMPGTRPGTTIG